MASKKEVTEAKPLFNDRIITLRSVYDKSGIVYWIQPCKNKQGQYPSCVKRVDSNGDMILSDKEKSDFSEGRAVFFPEDHMFQITSGKTYDLDKLEERAEWEAIQNCPLIAKSRDEKDANGNLVIDGPISLPSKPARNGVAELYIDRPGLETSRRVTRKQLVHKACSYIYDDPKGVEGQLNVAMVLGKDMRNQPIADVIDYLLRVAEKDPKKIIDIYTGSDMALRLLLIEAKKKKVIRNKNGIYIFGEDTVLGTTDEAVISWMKDTKNLRVLEMIKKETYPDYFPSAE